MDGGIVGASAAPSFPGGSGFYGPPPTDDKVVYTTKEATPNANLWIDGAPGFVPSGDMLLPTEAVGFATAALAASFCPVPSEDIYHGGNAERIGPQQQPHRRSAYAFSPTFTDSGGDGSRGREGSNYDWGSRPHNESWQVNGQGFVGNREEQPQAAGRHGGNAGAWDRGVGTFTKRQARMHALELELLERGQSSKRARSTMAPSLPVAYGTGFLPPSRDLVHLPQDNRRMDNAAMYSTAANPGTPFGAPVHGKFTTKGPIAATRSRLRGYGVQEEQDHHPQGPSGKRVGKSVEPPCSRGQAKAGKRNIGNRCQHPECSRGSTFGLRGGARSTIYCATHKHEGMVKITSRQCAEGMCSTTPSYGFLGNRASCCAKHKMPGMVNVVTPRCQKDGCASCASYGYTQERRPLFCARHAQDGMSNVVSRRCLGAGCTKNPSYGRPGDRRASFCVDHQQTGMSNIVSPKCLAPGCSKAPSFGANGERKASWCKTHKQDGMINILYSRQLKKSGIIA